jgi:hypothetical protein
MTRKLKKDKDRPEIARNYSRRSGFPLKGKLKIVSSFQPE